MRCQGRRQLTDRQSLSIPSRHRRIVFNQISQLMKLENPELCVAFGPAISRHKNSSTSLLANCKLSLRLAKRDNRATRKSPAEEKIPPVGRLLDCQKKKSTQGKAPPPWGGAPAEHYKNGLPSRQNNFNREGGWVKKKWSGLACQPAPNPWWQLCAIGAAKGSSPWLLFTRLPGPSPRTSTVSTARSPPRRLRAKTPTRTPA